jgi:hypothetical protein
VGGCHTWRQNLGEGQMRIPAAVLCPISSSLSEPPPHISPGTRGPRSSAVHKPGTDAREQRHCCKSRIQFICYFHSFEMHLLPQRPLNTINCKYKSKRNWNLLENPSVVQRESKHNKSFFFPSSSSSFSLR